jgi:Protein of unknown function (DUF3616)
MKRLVLFLLLFFCFTFTLGEDPKANQQMHERVISGKILLPEISGVVSVGNRLLVAADDPESKDKPLHMIALLEDAVDRLESKQGVTVLPAEQIYENLLKKIPGQAPDAETLKDLEDVAASPQGDIFLITSHSRNKKNKAQIERQRLVRLRVNKLTGQIDNLAFNTDQGLLEKLPVDLATSTQRRPGDKNAESKYDPGFNIEGLAWAPPGDLLIGVRSPTRGAEAIILRLNNVNNLFDKPTEPVVLTMEAELDLGGLGIRGMCYDEERKGYWIIAGLSPDPDEADPPLKNEWSIWFWNGKVKKTERELKKEWQKADLPAGILLNNPEAVGLIKKKHENAAHYLLLISDDGAGKPSSFVLIPLAKFGKQ